MVFTSHSYVTAGVVLAGASLMAIAPVTAPLPYGHVANVQLAADEESITLDLVRHGETVGSPSVVGGPAGEAVLPGPALDATGQEQAQAVAQAIQAEYPNGIAGVYAGQDIRMPETAAPLAQMLDQPVQILPGLNEIAGGIYYGDPLSSPGGILYELTLAAWAIGLEFVPMPGSPNSFDGVAFDESFGSAVQTIYDNTVSGSGPTTDVAISGEAAIATWALMNVNNPDLSIFLPLFFEDVLGEATILPDTGQVVVEGDPGDWTLVSFNGEPIPQDPGLLTELFVDVRDLIMAPQTAAYNIFESLLTGNATTIENAIQAGVNEVATATAQFPVSVIDDIVNALDGGTSSDLSTDLTNLLSTAATDVSGLLPGELGTMLAAAFTAL
jgi:Histidine phosphatase superfamily (branch 1)